MLEIIGWIGSISFAVCGIPQAWKSYKQGHSRGMDSSFLLLWFLGEACMIVYTVQFNSVQLLFNYILNFTCLLFIIKFKVYERNIK